MDYPQPDRRKEAVATAMAKKGKKGKEKGGAKGKRAEASSPVFEVDFDNPVNDDGPAFAVAPSAQHLQMSLAGSSADELAGDVIEKLSPEQLKDAQDTFNLFDKDGHGEIGTKELIFALARLGQHPTAEEVDEMIAEFDDDGNGKIDFKEFLVMMDQLGWNNDEISDKDKKRLQISYYGQASIVRWLTDDSDSGGSGDVTGLSVPALQRFCRNIVMARTTEMLVYLCIFAAAVISGMQSYKVDSEFEDATWCKVADGLILVIFTAEILVRRQPQAAASGIG